MAVFAVLQIGPILCTFRRNGPPASDVTMTTCEISDSLPRKTAKFTVTQAARAFRKARAGAAKVELVDLADREVRRDATGRFVLSRLPKNGSSANAIGVSTAKRKR